MQHQQRKRQQQIFVVADIIKPPVIESFTDFGRSVSANGKYLVVSAPMWKSSHKTGRLFIYSINGNYTPLKTIDLDSDNSLIGICDISRNGYRAVNTVCIEKTTYAYIFRKERDWAIEDKVELVDIQVKNPNVFLNKDSTKLSVVDHWSNKIQTYKLAGSKWKYHTTITTDQPVDELGKFCRKLRDREDSILLCDKTGKVFIYNLSTFELQLFRTITVNTYWLRVDMFDNMFVYSCPLNYRNANSETGVVYVYENNRSVATLSQSDIGFGSDVMFFDRDTLLVGACLNNKVGSIIVYRREGDNWVPVQTLTPTIHQKGVHFGANFLIEGGDLICPIPRANIDGYHWVGCIQVFRSKSGR